MATLATELTRLRKESRLSLRRVERLTGVSNAYLSQLETGKVVNPSPHVLRKLADVYGVPHDELLIAANYIDRPVTSLPPRIAALFADVTLSDTDERAIETFVRHLVSSKR